MTGTRILKRIFPWTAIVLAALIPVKVRAQSNGYTAPRNAIVNAAGARVISIEAGAGFLHINGRPGLTQVRVTGVARASSRRILDEVKLQAERQGDVVLVKMVVPDRANSLLGSLPRRLLPVARSDHRRQFGAAQT